MNKKITCNQICPYNTLDGCERGDNPCILSNINVYSEKTKVMKCPYSVNRICQTVWEYEFDEEGRETSGIKTEINNAEMINCVKENCGAFQNGKCCYGKLE